MEVDTPNPLYLQLTEIPQFPTRNILFGCNVHKSRPEAALLYNTVCVNTGQLNW